LSVKTGEPHIHPYSAKVGFNHSHNLSPRAKAWANAVSHGHSGRSHSHPLPPSGIKHQHPHKHGGRSHKHPLPESGVKHFHRLNKQDIIASSHQNTKPRVITGLSIKQQMAAVLKSPANDLTRTASIENTQSQKINIKDKKYAAFLKVAVEPKTSQTSLTLINQKTINKILNHNKPSIHRHDGRAHQHSLPEVASRHIHKHAHAGRIHSHLMPISNTAHKHRGINTRNTIVKKAPFSVKRETKQNSLKKVNKRRVATIKKAPKITKPYRAVKQTPQQITAGNRQFALALRYENGTGVKRNLPQAFNWYLRAAKQGNAKAQFNLASLYENGEGITRNIPQAMHWYNAAAQNGDANAQLNLGNRYAKGILVAKNINEAAKWYKRAADQGSMRGRANLNYLIEDNNGVIKR
jgi:hypothetical protein